MNPSETMPPSSLLLDLQTNQQQLMQQQQQLMQQVGELTTFIHQSHQSQTTNLDAYHQDFNQVLSDFLMQLSNTLTSKPSSSLQTQLDKLLKALHSLQTQLQDTLQQQIDSEQHLLTSMTNLQTSLLKDGQTS